LVYWSVATRAKSAAVPHVVVVLLLELLLHLADERRVLVQELPVLGADGRADLFEVLLQLVEDALQALLILHPAVEPGEHLVRVVDRRDRLVRPGVDHAAPGVGPVRDHHAELQRAEPRAGRLALLELIADLLVDRAPLGPAGRRVRAALDVPREQLDTRQQAPHAPHVVVAVAPELVADAVEDQRLVLERLQRLEALLERELRPLLVRPEGRGDHPVGAEHDHQPPLPRPLIGEPQAGQVQDERDGCRADPEVADELAATAARAGHVSAPSG
jgi:hypothetical protein